MTSLVDLCVIRSQRRIGEPAAAAGCAGVLDDYLRFVAGRCRPNTVLAAAYDLKVFFTVVGKQPEQVQSADVLAFVTAQRSGRPSIDGLLRSVDDGELAVSLATCGDGCRRCLGCTRMHRDRAMVAAMVLGALRRSEVLGLRFDDARVAERRVFIAEGKGGHQRLVPVSGRSSTTSRPNSSPSGHPG